MLHPAIWDEKLGLGWDDNLCIDCVEARLGRRLSGIDFICYPSVDGYPGSDKLVSRYACAKPKPRRKKRK